MSGDADRRHPRVITLEEPGVGHARANLRFECDARGRAPRPKARAGRSRGRRSRVRRRLPGRCRAAADQARHRILRAPEVAVDLRQHLVRHRQVGVQRQRPSHAPPRPARGSRACPSRRTSPSRDASVRGAPMPARTADPLRRIADRGRAPRSIVSARDSVDCRAGSIRRPRRSPARRACASSAVRARSAGSPVTRSGAASAHPGHANTSPTGTCVVFDHSTSPLDASVVCVVRRTSPPARSSVPVTIDVDVRLAGDLFRIRGGADEARRGAAGTDDERFEGRRARR